MRTTKESLLRLARDTAAINANQDHSIVCIYLTGSLITDDPFLGGTTDVDLFYVHTTKPLFQREIRFLSDDVTLDIAHVEQGVYQQPRQLRTNAWLGPFLCAKPRVLFDTRHWFEFTEASVAAQFYNPENMMDRARPLAVEARRIWMDFHQTKPKVSPQNIEKYLHCLELAGNSIALLSGAPLTLRRFFLDMSVRTQVINRPSIYDDLCAAILPPEVSSIDWSIYLPDWVETLGRVSSLPECPEAISSPRGNYYVRAVESLFEEKPAAAAWIMLNTWTQASVYLKDTEDISVHWKNASEQFLNIESTFDSVMDEADQLLDYVEESLDIFSSENGLSE
jgi:hypothetical protein